ncbi:beta-lactamase family protein [Streptomyces sp. NBC_01261]|uniref:serine hydrolase domain-containing protein n=1 Tax=Streptomyces sp. NBC_01261 TaxID=2903802 RepID=UPI002E34EB99|nr:serine hydrolase domain-containing protein [Streptomyces sp. NBC_01261]
MSDLTALLEKYVAEGAFPGAVALVDRSGEVEVAAVGSTEPAGSAPMRADTLFRLSSVTKPVTAAAVLALVDDGVLTLDAPIARWLPELAFPKVVRTPASELDDVVPAARPITVEDVLSSRSGWGFGADFTAPALQPLFADVAVYNGGPRSPLNPDEWVAALADIPLLRQPGEAFLYNAGSDLQGVLVARAAGRGLPEFLAERIFEPLGMKDTAFSVPASERDRLTPYYLTASDGTHTFADAADGAWSTPPAFASGAGGLVSTVADWHAFGRMLLAGGGTVLSPESVRLMTTDHLTADQRAEGDLFLQGQGWGYGGSVDVTSAERWNTPGRYGWVGGTGTAAHIDPSTDTVTVLFTPCGLSGPAFPAWMCAVWTYAVTV